MTKTVGVIACSKSKRGEAEPNRQFQAVELYDSWLFNGRVEAVESHCEEFAIMSAEHGYVHPYNDYLSYYDKRITALSPKDRQALAEGVVEELPAADRVLILMGRDYAKPLTAALPDEVEVWDPLEGVQLFDQRSELRALADSTTQTTLKNTETDGGENDGN